MVDWIVFMVTGLLLDACGAVMIISPLWNLYNNQIHKKIQDKELRKIKRSKEIIEEDEREVRDNQKIGYLGYTDDERQKNIEQIMSFLDNELESLKISESNFQIIDEHMKTTDENKTKYNAYWGLSFLLTGFSFQIIANILQWIKI